MFTWCTREQFFNDEEFDVYCFTSENGLFNSIEDAIENAKKHGYERADAMVLNISD